MSDYSPCQLDAAFATTRLLSKRASDENYIQQRNHASDNGGSFPECSRIDGGLRTQGWRKRSWQGRYVANGGDVVRVDDNGETPCVSVITVVYNAADTLEDTIRSVLVQDYPNIEYIVIDGGSSDGTLEIIKRYSDKIDYWRSEPDTGIYNAMNKGLRLAAGDVIAFLNAQDSYYPHTVSSVVNGFADGVDYVYGNIARTSPGKPTLVTKPLPAHLMATKGIYEMGIPHMTLFAHKRIYEAVGGYDESFRVAADHDLVNRIVANNFTGVDLDIVLARFAAGGISSGFAGQVEEFRVARKAKAPLLKIAYYFVRRVLWFYFGKVVTQLFGDKAMNHIRRMIGSRYVNPE